MTFLSAASKDDVPADLTRRLRDQAELVVEVVVGLRAELAQTDGGVTRDRGVDLLVPPAVPPRFETPTRQGEPKRSTGVCAGTQGSVRRAVARHDSVIPRRAGQSPAARQSSVMSLRARFDKDNLTTVGISWVEVKIVSRTLPRMRTVLLAAGGLPGLAAAPPPWPTLRLVLSLARLVWVHGIFGTAVPLPSALSRQSQSVATAGPALTTVEKDSHFVLDRPADLLLLSREALEAFGGVHRIDGRRGVGRRGVKCFGRRSSMTSAGWHTWCERATVDCGADRVLTGTGDVLNPAPNRGTAAPMPRLVP